MKIKVISFPYIFQVLYVLYFTRPRYQVSVYRTIGPLVSIIVYRGLFNNYVAVTLTASIHLSRVVRNPVESDTNRTVQQ